MGTEFRNINSLQTAVDYVVQVITEHLDAGQRVLWVLTGGSAIQVAVEASRLLREKPLEKLVVTLTDERYGPVGHADSNWQQLEQAGFSLPGMEFVPVLRGMSLEATGQAFSQGLRHLLDTSDYRIGIFGIGPDGHTAGMLPGSSATESTELAVSYEDASPALLSPGVKRGISRVTMTSSAIACLDEAIVYAIGETKWPQLRRLADTIDIAKQPAQALKRVPKLIIFTDMKEGEL